jgi:hypothetical protein
MSSKLREKFAKIQANTV